MRFLPVLLLSALAGGLFYLSVVERSSTLALSVVELEGQLGVPLYAPMLVLAVVFGALALVGGAPPARKARPGASAGGAGRTGGPRDAPRAGPRVPGDWQAGVGDAVQSAVFEDGAELQHTGRPQLPYVLRLRRMTPERARRAIGDYAQLVGGMPTPPRARVEFVDMTEQGAPRHHLVAGAFSGYFERTDFRCIRSGDHVDVLFTSPDKRWLA